MHGRREALYHHVVVEENSGDFRGIEQVLHVVGGLAQLLGLTEVLHVEGHELLIEALHFLLIGHGLLVGALQLLVGALQLLIGAFQLFHTAFHVLNGGLEAVLGVLQLFFQRLGLGVVAGVGNGSWNAQAHLAGRGLFLKHQQQQAGKRPAFFQGPHREAQQLHAGIQAQLHVVDHHVLMGGHGLLHSRAQLIIQVFAGHVEDVHTAQAGSGFQVAAGAAVHVQNFSLEVNHHGGRGVVAQQLALHQRGERAFFARGI